MSNNVKLWCQSCDLCARRKLGPRFGKSPLQSSPHKSTKPLDRIAIDILGGLPKTNTCNGNKYIINVGDFSKWKEAYAVSDHTALTVDNKSLRTMVFQIRYIQIKGENLRVNYFLNFIDSWVLRKQEPLLIDLSLMDL